VEKITSEQYGKISTQLIIDFLKNAGPKERHQLVSEWNHDSGYDVFNWIMNDPETDKATALMMYWMSGGAGNKIYANRDDMMETASWDAERYDFIELLEEKYLSGFYKNQILVYDPTNDMIAAGAAYAPAGTVIVGHDWTKDDWGEPKRELPSEMLNKVDGESIEPEKDWAEGVPPHIWEEMRKYTVIG